MNQTTEYIKAMIKVNYDYLKSCPPKSTSNEERSQMGAVRDFVYAY